MKPFITPRRAGFTLVEMLVVIVIIGILAGLITVVAAAAIKKSKEGVRLAEMGQMAAAIKSYKARFGRVPPDFSNNAALTEHILKRFPRISSTGKTNVPTNINPAEALVLWLQGQSANVQDPFNGGGNTPLFEFDKSRLREDPGDTDGFLVYYPPDDNLNPYVYFDMLTAGTSNPSYGTGTNQIKPYSGPQDEFQILCAGVDMVFGGYSTTPAVGGYPNGPFPEGHADNLGTFSTRNMEDSIP